MPLQPPESKPSQLKGSFVYTADGTLAVPIARKIRPSRRNFIAKLQAPLDTSDDARGGMGQMTPSDLLLYDEGKSMVRLISEEERGHTALLRLAIKHPNSKVYVKCEIHNETDLHIVTELPPQGDQDW